MFLTVSSSTTSSSYYQPYTATISGSIGSNTWTYPEIFKSEDEKIKFKLQDGTEVVLTLKQYIVFTALYGMAPSECKNKEEFDNKMGPIVI